METKKLQILRASLEKKEASLDVMFSKHFESVKLANGQPLNDKRNGNATLNKWEKQNDAIRNIKIGIEKTKRAIEIEEGKIFDVKNTYIPDEILKLVKSGELNQWRKHPNTFFIPGVDKARIVWDNKRNVVAHRYAHSIIDQEQWAKFVKVYNNLSNVLN